VLDHLQKSSVRFTPAERRFRFINRTPRDQIITSALDTLQKISSAKNNYVRDGLLRKSHDEEPRADQISS